MKKSFVLAGVMFGVYMVLAAPVSYIHLDVYKRQELGDLSELAASIKENGVYQNLTVIPGHYLSSREYISKCVDEGGDAAAAAAAWAPKVMWVGDDYTIIIGHRRAAAAQQAGLYELPCAIVEMDEREQMQTMMVENMQRSDLTVYEQAQGFQMMMDFGQTVEQISDKSGFSQSTVRRLSLIHISMVPTMLSFIKCSVSKPSTLAADWLSKSGI